MQTRSREWIALGVAWVAALALALVMSTVLPKDADAAEPRRQEAPAEPPPKTSVEASLGAGYTRSNFGSGNYNWNRRYGASLAYNFSERSGLELSFQDVLDRTSVKGYEDTTFHDVIYGLNWIQSIAERGWRVQPYFKGGIGLLNRDATAYYAQSQVSTVSQLDQITGIVGAGVRVYITQTFALRFEATSYLTGGMLRTWEDNIALNSGVSLVF